MLFLRRLASSAVLCSVGCLRVSRNDGVVDEYPSKPFSCFARIMAACASLVRWNSVPDWLFFFFCCRHIISSYPYSLEHVILLAAVGTASRVFVVDSFQ